MKAHPVIDRETWFEHRAALLKLEKAHTAAGDKLAALRRDLPWVAVEKDYQFLGPEGQLTLSELFKSHSQLIVYHLMFGANWQEPCIGCAQWADALNGTTKQFSKADARLIAVSRASPAQIMKISAERNWTFSWFSSAGSDFNIDYGASLEDITQASSHLGTEQLDFDKGENHGVSVFCKDDAGQVYHSYSCYNRGIEAMNSSMGYLDLLPKGRTW